MQQLPVAREPVYFGDGPRSLFGWYHAAPAAPAGDFVAVICPPIGFEYSQSHRTVRHLADRLAQGGIPALRFDYHGTGDSPGTELDSGRLSRWRSDILTAVAAARRLSGRARVCLVGLRLGATLAALASTDNEFDLLVMWNPCVKGRTYLRELQAIAMTAAREASGSDGAMESAGLLVSAETIAALREVDLTKSQLRASRRILLLGRDDQARETALAKHLAQSGVAFDQENVPGWAGIMAEEQYTVIPEAALTTLVDWVRLNCTPHSPEAAPTGTQSQPAPGDSRSLAISFDDGSGVPVDVEEQLCRFGPGDRLFGILSRTSAGHDRPVVVLFNAGSVHHVGPHRSYVALTRSLAAMGFACFRFDLGGIGDSVLDGTARENHPYPETAIADTRLALEMLARRFGYRQFIAMGLCSGAHNTFHTGLAVQEHAIDELVMINPLTFYWKEGLSLATARRFADAKMYKTSMFDSQRWLKLLSGGVDLRRPIAVALGELATVVRSYYGALWETLWPARGPRLSRDLRSIFATGRHVTFIIAQGDPGRDILMANARRTASKAIRSGRMRIEIIPGADHTFSQYEQRAEMIRCVRAVLKPRLASAEPSSAPDVSSAR